MHSPIALMVSDRAVLSSLGFALSIEGIELAAVGQETAAAVLVIDQGYQGDGLAALLALRAEGRATPAIVLATHPTASFRAQAASAGAVVIEKPLLGDELSSTIYTLLEARKAA